MAKRQKVKRFSIQGYDVAHYKQTEEYARAIIALYDRATIAIARAAARGNYDPETPFTFDRFPSVKKVMEKVTRQLADRMTAVIETGSRRQWLFACAKNDGFIDSIMDTSKLSKARLKKMQDQNLDALKAFQGRKVEGMNLSQRVWKYTEQYREQIEMCLDVGLGEGTDAYKLAHDVKRNLLEPDRLFRRVRDKRGNLVLSKNARAYHPGRGVYRSSARNAQRLTRSEINMAYRESDYLRWQQLDFVVGFEIHRSNHEPLCKCKICEKLVGRYPKTFRFKGWHPQCMCYAVPILMDEKTFDDNELSDLKSALNGKQYKKMEAKNTVTDVPDGFKEWVKEHLEASEGWASTPYFIKDNFVDGQLSKGLKPLLPETPTPIITSTPKNIPTEPQTPTPAHKDLHKPLSEMSEEEVKMWRSKWEKIQDEFDGFGSLLHKYNIDGKHLDDLIGNALYEPRETAKYWFLDEAKAELARIKAELLKAQTKDLKEISVTIPYHPTKPKMTDAEKVQNLIENIKLYYGEDDRITKYAISCVNSGMSDNFTLKVLRKYIDPERKMRLDCAKRLEEVKKELPKEVAKIPSEWHKDINDAIDYINQYDGKSGIENIINHVEYVYNMHKLVQSPEAMEALKQGRLSKKMPYQLFYDLEKKIPGISKDLPSKELFDAFHSFVPMYVMKNDAAYYSASSRSVFIGIKDPSHRFTSTWYKKGLFHHEYGHALDWQWGWRKSDSLDKLYKETYEKMLSYENNRPTFKMLNDVKKRIQEYIKDNGGTWGMPMDMQEKLGALTDVLQAIDPMHEFIAPRGHAMSYFKSNLSQKAEFIAHCVENYFSGNDEFKKFCPELYEKTREWVKGVLDDLK